MRKAELEIVEPHIALSAADHFALVMTDKDAEIAQLQVRIAKSNQREQRLAAQIQDHTANMAVVGAMATAERHSKERRALADKLAKAYDVDWNTHALEPLSGKIVPLEENHGDQS